MTKIVESPVSAALPDMTGYRGFPSSQDRLFSGLYDFLLIGGLSILLYPLFFLIPETDANKASWGAAIFLLAFAINYPHFAFSYQLLYSNFRNKISGKTLQGMYRFRYIFASIIVPLIITSLFLIALQAEDSRYMEYGVHTMAFFVGWHYVKQGYGVFIVTSLLQKVYYTPTEKNIVLFNSYLVWLFSWTASHSGYIPTGEGMFHGMNVFNLMVPEYIPQTFGSLMLLTFPIMVYVFIRKYQREKKFPPLSGIAGYLSALYFWLILHGNHFAFFVIAPAFHSLQYILFVWRFKTHEIVGKLDPSLTAEAKKQRYANQLLRFIGIGLILGGAGFLFIPATLNALVPFNPTPFGPYLFTVMFVIFINIHHYFIDNVLWRKDNKEAFQYLLH